MSTRAEAGGDPPGERADTAELHSVAYDGEAGRLFRIVLVNLLLSLATLGAYHFWGKTRLRRYLWSRLTFLGDRLEYTGTGKELLLGFLIVLAILLPLLAASSVVDIVYGAESSAATLRDIVLGVVFLFLVGVAVYRARRYRLSRSRWRGIRAAQDGSSLAYGGWNVLYTVLAIASLGLLVPLRNVRLAAYRMRNTYIGDRQLAFDASARDLFPSWLGYWVLLPFTLGLSYVWYKATEFRYFARCTSLDDVRFSSSLSGGQIFVAYACFAALAVLVLGGPLGLLAVTAEMAGEAAFALLDLLLPAIAVVIGVLLLRPLYYVTTVHLLFSVVTETLAVHGTPDTEAMAQSPKHLLRRGEGLAEALDVDGL